MEGKPTNREQRRHPEKLEEDAGVEPMHSPQSSQHDLVEPGNQDAQSVRAKSTGHGKKTADKWNQ